MDSSQKNLLKEISETQFAFIECSLYLDTHPEDVVALAKRDVFLKKLQMLTKQYEAKYGPLTLSADFGNNGFDWVNDPWPWEKEAN